MKARKSRGDAHREDPGPTRVALTGVALDELTTRVQSHFDEHKPEPASFPAMASRVIDLAEHPDVDIARLAHLIERDPAICAAVLAVANSAANRVAAPVQAVRTATMLLGLKRVANIAVGVACRSLFDIELRVEQELFPGWWERLFHSAMTEAFAASFVAMERNRGAAEGIFLAGMLHDIGKSLGLRSLAALIISGKVRTLPDDEAIEEILRRIRVPIGVTALTSFNLPETLLELCRHQDDDDLPDTRQWMDLHIVRLVAALNDLRLATINTAQPIRSLLGAARSMKLGRDDLLKLAQQVSDHAAQVGLLFSTSDGADETGYLDFVARCGQEL